MTKLNSGKFFPYLMASYCFCMLCTSEAYSQESNKLDIIDNVLCLWDGDLFLSAEIHPGNFIFGFPQNWGALSGQDGSSVIFPSGWNTAIGDDGRLVAYPPEWEVAAGPDGRLVAFPALANWDTVVGADGRMVAYPKVWEVKEGTDGRVVSFPKEWIQGIGTDGRIVVYPDTWKCAIGTDGRKLAYPASWITLEGTDGRKIGYPYEENILPNLVSMIGPVGPWTSMPGRGGRSVAFPARWKVFPLGEDLNTGVKQIEGGVAMILPDLTDIARIQHILEENELTQTELLNHCLYLMTNKPWKD